MSVYKCHAFIFLDQPPPWPSRTPTVHLVYSESYILLPLSLIYSDMIYTESYLSLSLFLSYILSRLYRIISPPSFQPFLPCIWFILNYICISLHFCLSSSASGLYESYNHIPFCLSSFSFSSRLITLFLFFYSSFCSSLFFVFSSLSFFFSFSSCSFYIFLFPPSFTLLLLPLNLFLFLNSSHPIPFYYFI